MSPGINQNWWNAQRCHQQVYLEQKHQVIIGQHGKAQEQLVL